MNHSTCQYYGTLVLRSVAMMIILLTGVIAQTQPALAQNCFQQNGTPICCDGNGNCLKR
jgi:hypothetical protein